MEFSSLIKKNKNMSSNSKEQQYYSKFMPCAGGKITLGIA